MSHKLNVLVVGGGIGGLTTAIALRRAGHQVTVLEKSSLSHEIGQGITLAPNGGRILQRLGLDFERWKIADYTGTHVVRADTLEVMNYSDLGRYAETFGIAMKTAYRIDLHAGLLDLATSEEGDGEAVVVKSCTSVRGWDADAGTIPLDSGDTMTADLIIAADGVRSHAAKHVLGDQNCPELDASGTIVYRFTVPTDRIKNDPETAHLLDAGPGKCTFNVSPAKDRWLVRYYCRDNEICNFALYALRTKVEASEQENELRYKTDRASLQKEMEGFHPSLLKVAGMAADVLPLWRCTTREPLEKLHRGKMVIIGDAAHPVLPHHGLGAVSAIEDAGVLGALLQDLGDEDCVEDRLEMYSKLRAPRVAAYKYWSDVPFFQDAVAESRMKLKKWFDVEELPKDSIELREWYMSFDVVADAKRALQERSAEC